MQNETPTIQNNQEAQTKKSKKIFLVLIIFAFALQIITFFITSWFLAYSQIEGGPGPGMFSAFVLGIFVSPIVGFIGLVLSLVSLIKKTYKKTSIALLITSVLMITIMVPWFLESKLSTFFLPMAEKSRLKEIKDMNAKSANAKEEHYIILSELFRNPQKIVEVKDEYLLLENGQVLKLFGFNPDYVAEFEKYANDFLVGKEAKFGLPNHDDFIKNYISGGRTGLFVDKEYEWPKDPKLNVHYGNIPVLIYQNGELINLKYCYKGKLQEYQ